MSTQLATPTITATVVHRTSIEVSGLSVANASGYEVKIGSLSGGMPARSVSPVGGKAVFSGLYPRSNYYISARALGDDENYANSDWSEEIAALTGQVIDSEMDVPQIAVATESFTTVKITGLTQYEEYRYQIAASADAVESAPIRNTGNYGGYAYIRGLEPGTEYFVRFCRVDAGRCSLWSDVVSGSTAAVTATIEVTDGGDSGAGTLRQAVDDAADGTKILLKVASITLNSVISNASKRIFILGGLEGRTTIQAGNNNALLSMAYLAGRHLRFTGGVGANIAISGGHFDDCVIDAIISTGTSGFASSAGFTNSVISGCVSGGNALRYGCTYDTVIDGCYTTGTNADGGGASSAVLNNCVVKNCQTVRNGGGGASCTSTNCAFIGNTAGQNGGGASSGTSVNCLFQGNTAGQNGGGASSGTYTRCYFVGNTANGTAASNGGGGIATATAINCIITANKAVVSNPQGGGAWQTQLINCLAYGNTYGSSNNKNDAAQGHTVSVSIRDSTIDSLYVGTASNCSLYNTLYRYRSAAPTGADQNNLCYSGSESAYFIDADHGDYRLALNSPAIGAGSTDYVSPGDTDLAGNPRVTNGSVACGCYEFAAFELEPPTYSLQFAAGGQGTVAFTLPQYSDSFCLQYSSDAGFTDPGSISSASSGFALSGLSGDVWFRAKSVGVSGVSLDSAWTEPRHVYVDAEAPIVVVNEEPIEMVVGQTVDLLDGVAVDDDSSGAPQLHYQVIGSDNLPIEVDGQTDNPASGAIPKGNYLLKIFAADAAGNEGVADRGLVVLPPALTTPTLTLRSVSGTTVVLAGMVNLFATGWELDHNGIVSTITPDAAGYFVIEQLSENVTHVFKARALGDYAQPEPPATTTGDHRDSDWSDAVSVTILPPQPPVGAFWQWRTEPLMSHNGRIRQNIALRARIFDARSGELLPPTVVTGAEFTCWRLNADGTRTAVTGFNAVAVPNSAFSAAADDDGFNFTYIPDQTSTRMFAAAGRYVLVVAVQLASGNPFDIYSNELTVF